MPFFFFFQTTPKLYYKQPVVPQQRHTIDWQEWWLGPGFTACRGSAQRAQAFAEAGPAAWVDRQTCLPVEAHQQSVDLTPQLSVKVRGQAREQQPRQPSPCPTGAATLPGQHESSPGTWLLSWSTRDCWQSYARVCPPQCHTRRPRPPPWPSVPSWAKAWQCHQLCHRSWDGPAIALLQDSTGLLDTLYLAPLEACGIDEHA